jgi:hypothetical protein
MCSPSQKLMLRIPRPFRRSRGIAPSFTSMHRPAYHIRLYAPTRFENLRAPEQSHGAEVSENCGRPAQALMRQEETHASESTVCIAFVVEAGRKTIGIPKDS